jgi:hypothetical protein
VVSAHWAHNCEAFVARFLLRLFGWQTMPVPTTLLSIRVSAFSTRPLLRSASRARSRIVGSAAAVSAFALVPVPRQVSVRRPLAAASYFRR